MTRDWTSSLDCHPHTFYLKTLSSSSSHTFVDNRRWHYFRHDNECHPLVWPPVWPTRYVGMISAALSSVHLWHPRVQTWSSKRASSSLRQKKDQLFLFWFPCVILIQELLLEKMEDQEPETPSPEPTTPSSIPILLVTANVGSIFEDVSWATLLFEVKLSPSVA